MNVPATVAGTRQQGVATYSFPTGQLHARTYMFACVQSCLGASCESNHAHVLCNDSGGDFTTLRLFLPLRERLFFSILFFFKNSDIMSAPKICSPQGSK